MARHALTLTHRELLFYSAKLLNDEGKLCLILPVEQGENCIDFAKTVNLHCSQKILVHPNRKKTPKRLLLKFTRHESEISEEQIYIETDCRGSYSEQFSALVKDFYLKM